MKTLRWLSFALLVCVSAGARAATASGFELAGVNCSYLSPSEFAQRIPAEELNGYIDRLKAVCADFYAAATVPDDIDIVVIVVAGGHPHFWFISSRGSDTFDRVHRLIEKLQTLPAPMLKRGPIGFAMTGRIAGGTSARKVQNGAPPIPKEWKAFLEKSSTGGPLHFDEVVKLVCPK
jgi:NAD(P)H-dependent flavin oxidoreductase YrpB (nitropropane dioxygenase family)